MLFRVLFCVVLLYILLICSVNAALSASQREALTDIFDATSSSVTPLNWTIPDFTNECTKFEGITCDGSKNNVISIILNKRGLNGTLPSTINKLTGLTKLSLKYNQLSGVIPGDALSSMTNLNTVLLSGNQFDCPDSPITRNITRCDAIRNNLCTSGTAEYTPSCLESFPVSCRITPCFNTGEGKVMTSPVTKEIKPGLFVTLEHDRPLATMEIKDTNGFVVLKNNISIVNFAEATAKTGTGFSNAEATIYVIANSTDLDWTLTETVYSSPNNEKVPQYTYKCTLPGGATVEIFFIIYYKQDIMHIYDFPLTVYNSSLKFGVDIQDWVRTIDDGNSFYTMAATMLIGSSDTFTMETSNGDIPRFQQFPWIFIPYFQSTNITGEFRFPPLSQVDHKITVAGTFGFVDINDLVKIVSGTDNLAFRTYFFGEEQASFDPDLRFFFDFASEPTEQISPPGTPTSPSSNFNDNPAGNNGNGGNIGLVAGLVIFGIIIAIAIVVLILAFKVPAVQKVLLPMLAAKKQMKAKSDQLATRQQSEADAARAASLQPPPAATTTTTLAPPTFTPTINPPPTVQQ